MVFIEINMLILKKIVSFQKTPHIIGVENFNEGAKYEKTRNFNLWRNLFHSK